MLWGVAIDSQHQGDTVAFGQAGTILHHFLKNAGCSNPSTGTLEDNWMCITLYIYLAYRFDAPTNNLNDLYFGQLYPQKVARRF